MSTDYRALCAELLVLAEESISYRAQVNEAVRLIDRVRAALAQPEQVALTDEARQEFIEQVQRAQHVAIREGECPRFDLVECALAFCRETIPPAPEPVPISERLPSHLAGELDDQGTCWNYHPINLHYCLCVPDPSVHTHWLPANALPTPEATND